jgi:hypothetical protein
MTELRTAPHVMKILKFKETKVNPCGTLHFTGYDKTVSTIRAENSY